MGRPIIDPIKKFWSRVEKRGDDECWKWLGSFDKDGYGQMRDGILKIQDRGHKFSFKLHNGEIPKGMCVCHSCDTPSCTNPKHLFLGTAKENVADKVKKKRHAKGESQGQHKLTENQIIEIRLRANESYKTLCKEFNLVPSTVYRIWHNQSWKHI
jgi:hypothetical protein